MSETKVKVYPKGVRIFEPHSNAPDFVKGEMIIGIEELIEFCKGEGKDYLTDYKGVSQIKLSLLQGDKGLYTVVNTWKPKEAEKEDDLPF